jgi:DNA-binding transcriptional ArsR family regulator
MVHQPSPLDRIFGALADPTRRALLARLAEGEATVGELAEPLPMSLPAVSKHLGVLDEAGLVHRARAGRSTVCSIQASGLAEAAAWLNRYRRLWGGSLERLAGYLDEGRSGPR